MPTSFWHASGP